ncbi:MAG: gliding motility-associated C-terminal domain-containing protein [Bacteroidales bacterium]|nr:gliding motility-associated C-terminal domain-containing protein [Bacteroidales bacterium]
MKKLRLLLSIIIVFFLTIDANSQAYNIANYNGQTVSTCSGNFYDSGGPNGGYSGTLSYSITFCPSTPGASINLDFTVWSIGAGDNLKVYDGNSNAANLLATFNTTLSPLNMVVSASILNPSGCLTLEWTSNSSNPGWDATISCGLPCQNYSVNIQSSTPPFHLDSGFYYIDICPNDTVSITAQGVYNLNDSVYHQSDNTTNFYWDMGNGFIDTAQTVTTIYDSIRGYEVQLFANDSNGCLSSQVPKIRVRLSTQPDLTGTTIIQNPICQGDTTRLVGDAETQLWHATSSLNTAGVTYLPDGSGASYTSSLLFTSFNPGQTLQSGYDMLGIVATMEHSYLGDLNIIITCPSGLSATLKSYPGGGSTYLGEPIDNNSAQIPGIGYEYAWRPNGTTTMLGVVGTYNHNFTDALGTTYSNANYIPPSTGYPANATASGPFPLIDYLPETSFNSLIGCPLNGAWSITVTDNLGIDNGYIFAWGIEFASSVLPISWDYQPVISSEAWNNTSGIVGSGANVLIQPSDSGNFQYTYTVVDDFGCTYDTTLTVRVVPTPEVNLGNDTTICGFGIVSFDATSPLQNATYNWNTGNPGPIQQTNAAGTYIANVTYTEGSFSCSNSDTVIVQQYDIADVDLGNDTCATNDIVLYAGNKGHTPPFIYLWSDGSTADSLLVTTSGDYWVTVAIDPNTDCTSDDEIRVTIHEPDFLGADLTFCSFEQITVKVPEDGNASQHFYEWFLDGKPLSFNGFYYEHQELAPGDYTLTVNTDNGCTDKVQLKSLDCNLEIPNVITPNGDGHNDKFVIDGLENYQGSILVIYNRWGTKIYETNDYKNDWGNEDVADGVYYFRLITKVADRESIYNGTLTVLKN